MTQSARESTPQAKGVENRHGRAVVDPADLANPDEGPAMTPGGAQPSGSAMNHWATSQPSTDATKPETMPRTASSPLPGETEDRESV